MTKLMLRFLFFSFILNCISCTESDDPIYKDAVFIGKIWDSPRFCAFTDLVEYNNVYYCCFRESDHHIPSSPQNYGKIRILSSYDGVNWFSAALIEDPQYDLRDPKIEVTSDGRLMLLVGISSFDESGILISKNTRVSFSSGDLTELSNLKNVNQGSKGEFNNFWLWRAIWHKGKAYGVAYKRNHKPVLLESTDGINYTEITQFDDLSLTTNEAGITFRPNGNMVIAIRDNNSNGYIGESSPPFKNWEWEQSPIGINCPTLINYYDDIFLAIRNTSFGYVSLLNLDDQNKLKLLYNIDVHRIGDMGYPGLIASRGFLLMSYYNEGDIFLVKISLSKMINR